METLTDAAREGLTWAREAALHRGSAELRPVDLAVGMLASPLGIAARALASLDITHATASAALADAAPSETLDHSTPLTLARLSKDVLAAAAREQLLADCDAITTGHILGATTVPDWLMDAVVLRLGSDRAAIRMAIFALLSSDREAAEREGVNRAGLSRFDRWMRGAYRRAVRDSLTGQRALLSFDPGDAR
jgi:ATP-dependent Clp protease ATP-binding subunit ClpA